MRQQGNVSCPPVYVSADFRYQRSRTTVDSWLDPAHKPYLKSRHPFSLVNISQPPSPISRRDTPNLHLGTSHDNRILTPNSVVALSCFPELPLHPNPVHLELSLSVHEQTPVWSQHYYLEQRVREVQEGLRFQVGMKNSRFRSRVGVVKRRRRDVHCVHGF